MWESKRWQFDEKFGDLNMKIGVKPHIRNDSVASEMPASDLDM